MTDLVASVVIGVAAGYLSGRFGIGGGVVTTPAIRLLLGRPELVAVGTPLPVIVPTAIAGALAYWRRGLIDVRTGLIAGGAGAGFAVLGAWATVPAGGNVVLLVTAGLIGWMAIDMARSAVAAPPSETEMSERRERGSSLTHIVLLGVVTGLYSGFLGLGGGFIVVPALVRFFGFDIKRAMGTSLLIVSALAIPGSVTHYLLGNVELGLALPLTLGVVPGALLGARATARSSEKTVRVSFAVFLLLVGAVLALSELGVL